MLQQMVIILLVLRIQKNKMAILAKLVLALLMALLIYQLKITTLQPILLV